MKLSEAAKLINGVIEGDGDTEIVNIAKIEAAKPNEITFLSNPLYEKFFSSSDAGAVIVSKTFTKPEDSNKKIPLVRVDDPQTAFLILLDVFSPKTVLQKPGIASSAVISASAVISEYGTDTEIGDDVLIYPNVTIYNGCKIGNRVIIHSGTVIGSDGFGLTKNPDGSYQKIPQKGIVLIEDDVEIGSNCSVDRAALGATIIHKGVKLDNQIQIAHNVEIGENTVIAAHTGIAGSTKIGKNCMIGGKVGIVGHIEICDNVIITAATNVSKSITKPGTYSGYRAQPQMDELKQEAVIRNLRKK
jgi:UDP-3-O-[3-hydroxymyristoyl] glucosamine N-acyltransferase